MNLSLQSNLNKYLNEIYKIPLLTDEEEIKYAELKQNGDLNAAKILINSHLRLVVKIAFKYKNYGLSLMDMISEGNLGLMKAVKEFDLSKGCKLATYAMWWIKATIQDFILKSWSLVKIGTTAAQKKLFFNLNKLKNKIMESSQTELNDKNIKYIAETLNVKEEEVIDMDSRLNHKDIFLNKISNNSSNEDKRELIELIKDKHGTAETITIIKNDKNIKNRLLNEALLILNERERDIFVQRKLSQQEVTLKDLSQKYGISGERIRQIEEASFLKIKNYLINNYKKFA